MLKPPNCPYCGAEPVLREAEEIYGRPFGRVWVCANYPSCDSLVTCHRHTSRPLGPLANKALRALRHKAHLVFDDWWQAARLQRRKAYSELGRAMCLLPEQCHIGMMDEKQCERVIELYSGKDTESAKAKQVPKRRDGQTTDV